MASFQFAYNRIGRSLLLILVVVGFTKAQLRGQVSKELRQRAAHPVLGSSIQGKTLEELGIPKYSFSQHRTLESDSIQFFSVLNEYGPTISKLGESAGFYGFIFDVDSLDQEELSAANVTGALKGTCSVVATDNHFCTLEILKATSGETGTNSTTFGSLIASGVLEYAVDGSGRLLVEAAGDGYGDYTSGVVTVSYLSVGETISMLFEADLS
eukprot:Nitzschia sp. Nitz4//scaffold34_size148208//134790//135501//NITZ4_002996-RA/size148208-augustus-gene-0.65-mRNA-1//1//CDS//3329548843//1285//frame0